VLLGNGNHGSGFGVLTVSVFFSSPSGCLGDVTGFLLYCNCYCFVSSVFISTR